jgi:DNA-binding NtrC family response regulator
MSREVLDLFHTYPWPGNVRQLEHCVQHMVAVNSGPELHLRDLPTALLNHVNQQEPGLVAMANAVGPWAESDPELHFRSVLPLAEVEKRAIMEALRYTKGDRTTAANLLQIGRTTLYRKLKDYGLDLSGVLDTDLQ